MTTTRAASPALRTALAYFQAWTAHDFDRALDYLSDELVCHAPSGRIEGIAAFRRFMEPFSDTVQRAELLAAFGDEDTALLMYDTRSAPVTSAPGAERHTVREAKIVDIWIVFDRLPFAAAARASAAGS